MNYKEELEKYGYCIKQDYDGDADNYVRYMIICPDGSVYERGIYEYRLDSVIKNIIRNKKNKPIYSPDKTTESCIDTSPKNKTPLLYSHFLYTKRTQLRKKLETIFNELGIDNVMGIRDFVLAEMVDNFLMVTYNTKKAMEELGYNNVIDNER